MHDYAQRRRQPTRWLVNVSLVLVLHALLLWAISSGLAQKFVKVVKGPVEAVLLEETPPDIPPPPPPPPPKNLPPPPPAYVPPVEVQVSTPPPVNAIAAVSNKPQVEAPPSPVPVASTPAVAAAPSAPVRTAAVISASSCEKPDYPSASRRLEEEGTVTLRFLVGTDGRVKESATEKSSGFRRLDEAARQGLAKCLFKPGTENGQPVEGWANIKYTWRLD